MKTNRHPLSVSILALLLLHATMSVAWPVFPVMNGDLSTSSHSEVSVEHHSCHESGVSTSASGEKGCVFCGYVVQFASSRICLTISLKMTMPAPLVATAPRPVQPVEPPPPKFQILS